MGISPGINRDHKQVLQCGFFPGNKRFSWEIVLKRGLFHPWVPHPWGFLIPGMGVGIPGVDLLPPGFHPGKFAPFSLENSSGRAGIPNPGISLGRNSRQESRAGFGTGFAAWTWRIQDLGSFPPLFPQRFFLCSFFQDVLQFPRDPKAFIPCIPWDWERDHPPAPAPG